MHGVASESFCLGSRFVAFCRDEHIAGKANAPILDASDSERTVGAIICGPRVKEWKPSNINAGLPFKTNKLMIFDLFYNQFAQVIDSVELAGRRDLSDHPD